MNQYELSRVRLAQKYLKSAMMIAEQAKNRHLTHRERNHVDFCIDMLMATANEYLDVLTVPARTDDDITDIPF